MKKTHHLKCVQPYFDKVKSGAKTFEFRKNDRDFEQGDIVVLQEYDPSTQTYSGQKITGHIGYVLKDFPGIEPGYCVFSFKKW